MSDLKVGDIVDVTARGVRVEKVFPTSRWSKDANGIVAIGDWLIFRHLDEHLDGSLHTVNMGSAGVTVTPSGPSPIERALVVLADQVADFRAAELRCFEVNARSRAIEHQVAADAVRSGMITVLADYMGIDRAESAVLGAVETLITDAVVRRNAR